MLDKRKCEVDTPAQLNHEIRDIFYFDDLGQSEQICGTLHIVYSDESVKQASLLPMLEDRGVAIEWHKKETT